MSTGNAFWREVIDQIPHLVLLFRIDDQEEAHLMFSNQRVKRELGYTAKEYVLASESDKHVQFELSTLIDKVAKRSHDVDRIENDSVELTTKFGDRRNFVFDFDLFKSRAGDKRYIIVELQLLKERRSNKQLESETNYSEQKPAVIEKENNGWIVTDLLDQIVQRFEHLLEQGQPILVQGEHGVGKSRLIEHTLSSNMELPAYKLFYGDELNQIVQDSAHLAEYDALVVEELDMITHTGQRMLLNWWRNKKKHGKPILIMTITKTADELINAGKILPELYYQLGSNPLIVPPVRHRLDEMIKFATKYITKAAKVVNMKLGNPVISQNAEAEIKKRTWEGNLTELLEVLGASLIKAEPGIPIDLYIRKERQSSLFPEEHIKEEDVLNFDEMNRRYLERILEITSGKIYGDDGAAALLDLKPTTLQSKLKRLGIK